MNKDNFFYIKSWVRVYNNSVEIAVQDFQDEDKTGGWSHLVKKDKKLVKRLQRMFLEKNKRIAKNLMNHENFDIRFGANLVLEEKDYEFEKRNYKI